MMESSSFSLSNTLWEWSHLKSEVDTKVVGMEAQKWCTNRNQLRVNSIKLRINKTSPAIFSRYTWLWDNLTRTGIRNKDLWKTRVVNSQVRMDSSIFMRRPRKHPSKEVGKKTQRLPLHMPITQYCPTLWWISELQASKTAAEDQCLILGISKQVHQG